MAIFSYIVLDSKGRRISGIADGENIKSVKSILKEKGMYIINISESIPGKSIFFFNRIKGEDLAISIRELATLISSGIQLDECLTGLVFQMQEGKLKQVFQEIQEKIRGGKSFSNALRDYPQYFSNMITSMIKAGEESGTLDMILLRVADFLEKKISFKNKIMSIMTYPILMSIVAFMVLVFILSFVAPTITRIFNDISLSLPMTTMFLIKTSHFFKKFWLLFIIFILITLFVFRKASKTQKGIIFIDVVKLKMPFLKGMFIKSELASFSRTISTLLNGGVEILESLSIARNAILSTQIKKEVKEIEELLSKGGNLSSGFQRSRIFPYLVTQLVSAGEKSGSLPAMFDKIANIYEEEVTQRSAKFVSFIEPIMILFMGGVVGFIVLAVLLPIFQISQSIR